MYVLQIASVENTIYKIKLFDLRLIRLLPLKFSFYKIIKIKKHCHLYNKVEEYLFGVTYCLLHNICPMLANWAVFFLLKRDSAPLVSLIGLSVFGAF
jgi:hypothetical protein